MKYEHRVLIGVTGAIGKMGPHSQIITNRVAYEVGQELGNEMKDRGVIREGMSYKEVWEAVNKEIAIDPTAEIEESSAEDHVRIIRISSCNICPKKVGKYAIPATACPVGGIYKGVCEVIGLADAQTSLDLVPGETCLVSVGKN